MSTAAHLDLAVSEMALLGVRAKPIWRVAEWAPGVNTVQPGVEVGDGTYTVDESMLRDQQSAMDWALIVACMERGIEA